MKRKKNEGRKVHGQNGQLPTLTNQLLRNEGTNSNPQGRSGPDKKIRSKSMNKTKHTTRRDAKYRLMVGTLNCRTLNGEEKVVELEEELKDIKWDIIGLCETKRKGETSTILKSGNLLYNYGPPTTSTKGIGFIVNQKIKESIREIKPYNERIIEITIRINERYNLRILQVYAPTSTSEEEEIENFYEDLEKAINSKKEKFTIIMGDFNAKIGKNINNSSLIGNFGLGNRNLRGDLLEEFLGKQQLYVMNTFFKKKEKKKWTWRAPNGTTKNEIDYILTDKKHIIQDVSTISKFKFFSDHRLVRATVKIDTKWERTKLCSKKKTLIKTEILNTKCKEFKIEIENRFNLLEDTNDNLELQNKEITDIIITAAKKLHQIQPIGKKEN